MGQQWYCRVAGKEYGPVSGDTLQEWAQSARVSRDDMVRSETSEWMALGTVAGVKWPADPVPPPANRPNPPAIEITAAPRHKTRTKISKVPTDWWAIFDWRFEYYLTPWIIRILWVSFLVFTASTFLGRTYGFVSELLPEAASSSGQLSDPHFGVPSEPMISIPEWLKGRIGSFLLYFLSMIAITFSLLVTRVFLETMIVLFRIAEDIGTLRRKYADER